MYKILSDSILFKGLSELDIENLLNKINYQIKKYKSKSAKRKSKHHSVIPTPTSVSVNPA